MKHNKTKGGRMDNVYLGNVNWQTAEKMIKEARAVIIPLGSTEQHGHHMTLDTDNIVASYVSRRLAEKTGCVVVPTVQYGQVWSAKYFPSTFSIEERHYIDYVKDIVRALERNGARNIILFSGHWGNVAPIKILARELLDDEGYDNVYHMSYTNLAKNSEGIMESPLWNGSGFHAGEIETSILLAIAPETVDMSQAVCDYPEVPKGYSIRPVHWDKFITTGIFGDASKAAKEKGEKYLERWMNELTRLVTDNID